jgi:putative ABC transport system permease protein
MGLAQAAGAVALCVAVVFLCRWFAVHVEREAAISMARGLVQIVLVGMVLALLLHGSLLIGALILLLMTFAAAVTASRRLKDINGSVLVSFWAITAGGGIVIAGMLATGTLQPEISNNSIYDSIECLSHARNNVSKDISYPSHQS